MDFKQGRICYDGQETIEEYTKSIELISYGLDKPTNHELSWKQIWKSRIPHKVSCFVWLLAKEADISQDNIIKRNNLIL